MWHRVRWIVSLSGFALAAFLLAGTGYSQASEEGDACFRQPAVETSCAAPGDTEAVQDKNKGTLDSGSISCSGAPTNC